MPQDFLIKEKDKISGFSSIIIKEVTPQKASQYNALWHSVLPKIPWSNITRNTYYVNYGFFYKNSVVAVAIWTSPVAQNRFSDGKTMLELRRYAISEVCPKNFASWGLGKMVKMIKLKFPEITRLISYQDTSVHQGIIYKASNWEIGETTKFASWSTDSRKRNKDQSKGDKIRWEYLLSPKR